VKSGWATAVLVAGPATAPRVVDRRRIALSDPRVPETTQPYHAGFGAERTDARAIRRLTGIVGRCAARSMTSLIRAYRAMGFRPGRIALVVGSTIDPSAIANPHIRAHAHEGRLFRMVLDAAAVRHRLRSSVVLERELYAVAARALRRSLRRLQREATELGEAVGRPWRADDKAAAVAAWMLLARPRI